MRGSDASPAANRHAHALTGASLRARWTRYWSARSLDDASHSTLQNASCATWEILLKLKCVPQLAQRSVCFVQLHHRHTTGSLADGNGRDDLEPLCIDN